VVAYLLLLFQSDLANYQQPGAMPRAKEAIGLSARRCVVAMLAKVEFVSIRTIILLLYLH